MHIPYIGSLTTSNLSTHLAKLDVFSYEKALEISSCEQAAETLNPIHPKRQTLNSKPLS